LHREGEVGVEVMTPDIAWFTGLYEGEGTLYVCRVFGVPKQMSLRIGMSDSDVIQRIDLIWPDHGKFGTYQPKRPGSLPVYRWQVTRRQSIVEICRAMWPLLGERRRQQTIEVIKEYSMARNWSPAWPDIEEKWG
jgi:hypothetical protein